MAEIQDPLVYLAGLGIDQSAYPKLFAHRHDKSWSELYSLVNFLFQMRIHMFLLSVQDI